MERAIKKMVQAFRRTAPLLFFSLLFGCLPQTSILDNPHHTFSSAEVGISFAFPPGWRLSKSENTLFTADFEPTGVPLVHLTVTQEKDIPRLEDYLALESGQTLSQKTQKVSQGELSHLKPLSSGKFEFKGEVWGESTWLAERKGKPKIFHAYTIPVGLNLIQLHFEFPVAFYEGQQGIITPVLNGITMDPPKPSSEQIVHAYRVIGEIYKSKGLWKEAIEAFTTALEIRPKDPELHLSLAGSYFQNGEVERARSEFLDATALDPQNSRGYEGLADVYFKKGLDDQGVTAIRKAVSLSPENAALYVKLGAGYLRQRKSQEAIKIYQKLLRRNPSSADAHLGLGKAYLSIDLYEQAILEIEQALKLRPQDVDPHCLLEEAYKHLESTAEAEKENKLCHSEQSAPAP